ncbi:MAG: glutamine-hydrolyzing carbamoyl-phosphate synthase small subunit [Candidatus Omnitrophica bacterium]|nr:glutamine-hydrolyzing carbamoyl-phosphate synthase small subunit [Candidatus Omnitrophota bacterium]
MKAILMLEDGKSFIGESETLQKERVGEVITNTAVVGYQEMMTDPANVDKILVLTYPLVGNYGCAAKFNESDTVWLAGLVIKESSRIFSNWQARESLGSFIKRNGLLFMHSADTRTLAVHLRQKGSMMGVISTETFDRKELLSKIAALGKDKSLALIDKVSTQKVVHSGKSAGKRVAVLDLGVTRSIMRQIESLGCSLKLLPHSTSGEEILRLKTKGLIISSGPEDLPGLEKVAGNIRPLIGKLPILGIASGNLALAMALGAKINKLKIGHRGVNYPIQSPSSFKGEITAQNHAYILDHDSLLGIKGLKISSYNLNDRTVEGIESKALKIIGVQYMPVSPGFHETNEVFIKFMKMLGRD